MLPVVDLPNVGQQFPVKNITSDRHLQRVEGVLCDVIGVQIVHLTHRHINVRLRRVGEKQELRACKSIKALQAEILCLHDLETRMWLWSIALNAGAFSLEGVKASCDGVDTGGNKSATRTKLSEMMMMSNTYP